MSEEATYFWTKVMDGKTRLGLTKAGQDELGTIKFAHLPSVGDKVSKGKTLISVEAEKAVSDIDSPVSGEVVAVNPQLDNDFDSLNSEEEADAWLVDIKEN
ncbi:glycine cleavage system H protein [Secundilactobacillus pentosiphilus]|uniref:Glycine cleavage system H protein n=1 Tax=Secundilactobacillus pentosiphilus TaxID=1714682 RepID=A0A1Z5IRG1_9LACO|nr:glycine cleavage system protein H [Secundilactobacillus pentosiphilus]GAX04320.1 glycine cleavage system H protein [Secundilactobacillus pentosiphilus]GAX06189.1 glycine cleavage system H protein [Secundilactobacillus pentosiphilus]